MAIFAVSFLPQLAAGKSPARDDKGKGDDVRRFVVQGGGIPHLAKNERDGAHPRIGGQDRGLGIALLYCGSNTCMSNLPGKTRPWRILVVLLQACIAHLNV
jgi:hypothetical protein